MRSQIDTILDNPNIKMQILNLMAEQWEKLKQEK